MKKRFLIALFACVCLGVTGCGASKEVVNTDQVQVAVDVVQEENEEVSVSEVEETTDEIIDEASEEDGAKDTTDEVVDTAADDVLDFSESNVIVRDSLELDKNHTKVKFITDEDYTFEDEFILQYTEEIPEYKELINISDYYVKEYDLGNEGYVCVIREKQESHVADTCIYYAMSDFESYDKDSFDFLGYVPNEDDYEYTIEEQGDITIEKYADTLDAFSDWGTKYYDSDGHLLVWDHYLTSGCRQMFFIWDGDKVAMTIDTGGQAWDSDDDGTLTGIYTMIYKFNEPVSFEEIVYN